MISLINYIWSQYIQEIYKFFFNLSLYSLQICKNVPWRDCGIFSRVRQKSFGASHRGHGMKPRLDFPPLCLLEYFRGPLVPSWSMNPSLILESVAVFLASSDFFSTWLSHFETKPAIDANMSEIHNEISREIRYLVSGHKKKRRSHKRKPKREARWQRWHKHLEKDGKGEKIYLQNTFGESSFLGQLLQVFGIRILIDCKIRFHCSQLVMFKGSSHTFRSRLWCEASTGARWMTTSIVGQI